MLFGAAIGAATLYLAGLFWLAAWRDRSASPFLTRHSGTVYGLSLAVYCTSWTFFGGVGTAATAGLDYLPIYLGPILVFTLGFGLVRRILAQAKAQHSTSIADFLSARYGKSASVAALVTVIATIAGLLPIMLGSGTGSEVMRRIAAPMVGGMTSATILTLLVIPAAFLIWQRWELTRSAQKPEAGAAA